MTALPVDAGRLLAAIRFAAERHRMQKRKGAEETPYINHPIEVAEMLVRVGGVADEDLIIAALLHDTVEDTDATPEDLEERFGPRVRAIVGEVTDDKSLPKQVRKDLQVEHSPHLSAEAKQLKLCDKISNVTDVANRPPADWSHARKVDYLSWAERVVAGLRGVNPALEARFDEALATARVRLGVAEDETA